MSSIFTPHGLRLIGVSFAVGFGIGAGMVMWCIVSIFNAGSLDILYTMAGTLATFCAAFFVGAKVVGLIEKWVMV